MMVPRRQCCRMTCGCGKVSLVVQGGSWAAVAIARERIAAHAAECPLAREAWDVEVVALETGGKEDAAAADGSATDAKRTASPERKRPRA